MAELTYTKVGDYYIPDLTAEPLPSRDLGKYGHLRLHYLQDHKSELYAALLMEGKLLAHLLDIEDTANDWLDRMMPDMARAVGVTEELKACDQMAWVGLMNNCRAQVEEIIFAELVYC